MAVSSSMDLITHPILSSLMAFCSAWLEKLGEDSANDFRPLLIAMLTSREHVGRAGAVPLVGLVTLSGYWHSLNEHAGRTFGHERRMHHATKTIFAWHQYGVRYQCVSGPQYG